jgi:hypothetical protein
MVESYTSQIPQKIFRFSGDPLFSADIHVCFRGNFAIHPPGEYYAKFKTVQTPPYHCFQISIVILKLDKKHYIRRKK